MTDCGCDKAKAALEEYLRNELRGPDASDICAHVESCPECSGESRVLRVLTEAVQRACGETAPEELRAQVLLRIRLMQSSH